MGESISAIVTSMQSRQDWYEKKRQQKAEEKKRKEEEEKQKKLEEERIKREKVLNARVPDGGRRLTHSVELRAAKVSLR